MMKLNILFSVLFFAGCVQRERVSESIFMLPADSLLIAKAFPLGGIAKLASLRPTEFLQVLADAGIAINYSFGAKQQVAFIVFQNDCPPDWIRRKDMNSLVALMYSKQPCKCYVNLISSFLPFDSTAQVGGFAMIMVKAYKERQPFTMGTYECPKFDKEAADELRKWWDKERSNL